MAKREKGKGRAKGAGEMEGRHGKIETAKNTRIRRQRADYVVDRSLFSSDDVRPLAPVDVFGFEVR